MASGKCCLGIQGKRGQLRNGTRTSCGNLAGSNCPYWLIRNNDLLPVIFFDGLVDGFELLCYDLDSGALLSFF